jgi:N-terminal half of MaoC dehydratase
MVSYVVTTWISDEMRAIVGKEFGSEATSVPISLSDIRKWAMAVYYPETPPPLFWHEEYAATTIHGGIVAPEEFNPFAWFTAAGPRVPQTFEGPIRDSGPEGAFGVAAPETTFILNGGSEVTYGVRMRPGDVITSGKSKLIDYVEREARLGLMLFTRSETTWTNQNGEMVKVTRGTGIRY